MLLGDVSVSRANTGAQPTPSNSVSGVDLQHGMEFHADGCCADDAACVYPPTNFLLQHVHNNNNNHHHHHPQVAATIAGLSPGLCNNVWQLRQQLQGSVRVCASNCGQLWRLVAECSSADPRHTETVLLVVVDINVSCHSVASPS